MKAGSPHPVRKKLIEVSIPLEAINVETKRRKQKAPKGYPTSFHKYWAQRPIAACRAVIFAQMVDDPGSCADEFPTKSEQTAERARLHGLIERLVSWDVSTNEAVLSEARYEIARSVARARGEKLPAFEQFNPQQIIDYLQQHAPPVYDPFSGSGAIPLEAQRLGLKAIGSDLNPVAVLIGKALIEFTPPFAGQRPVNPEVNELHQWKGAEGLADDVCYYARWLRAEAKKRIGHLYPDVKLGDGKSEVPVVGWFWARTISSPDPRANGAQVPLVSTFVLSAKAGREVIVKPVVDRVKMSWHFEIDNKPPVDAVRAAKNGTKAARATFSCLITGTPISGEYINAEAQAGRMSERLMAMVVEGRKGRTYLAPNAEHAAAAEEAAKFISKNGDRMNLPTHACRGTFGSNAQGRRYKFKTFSDYYTPRQLVAMSTFSDLILEVRDAVQVDGERYWVKHVNDKRPLAGGGLGLTAYSDVVAVFLSIVLARMNLYGSSLCKWLIKDNAMASAIPQKGIEMTFDFVEGNPLEKSSSGVITCSQSVASCLESICPVVPGTIEEHDARFPSLARGALIATDPPYLDNVAYADLSDYFYHWHRRSLASILPDLFRRVATPKADELIAAADRHEDRSAAQQYFMEGMTDVFKGIASESNITHPLTVFYAYKQSESDADGLSSIGWAAFLQALLNAGCAVGATWPLRTENTAALKNDVNALASSIVLVCRRRDSSAPIITRADFLRALRREMPAALAEIRRAGVAPTDIQQAAIGPGIGIFTRHAQVLNTDGTPMLVKDALKLINQVREEITAHADGDYDSETRFALDWFAAKGFDKGASGDAITMCNAVNISLDGMKAAGFFDARGGGARLLKRDELPADWEPARDNRATVWEACQHLIKRLTAENGGVDAAAALYNKLGALAEPAHALARRLYDICEQKQWHSEARFYNQLHQEWDAIEKRAATLADTGRERDLLSL